MQVQQDQQKSKGRERVVGLRHQRAAVEEGSEIFRQVVEAAKQEKQRKPDREDAEQILELDDDVDEQPSGEADLQPRPPFSSLLLFSDLLPSSRSVFPLLDLSPLHQKKQSPTFFFVLLEKPPAHGHGVTPLLPFSPLIIFFSAQVDPCC